MTDIAHYIGVVLIAIGVGLWIGQIGVPARYQSNITLMGAAVAMFVGIATLIVSVVVRL